MNLNASHIRSALVAVAVCGFGQLATYMSYGSAALGVRSDMWPVLMGVLATGTVIMPLVGMLGRLSDETKTAPRVVAVVALAIALLSSAVFLDARFDVFPARLFCIVSVALSFVGALTVLYSLFSDAEKRSAREPRT